MKSLKIFAASLVALATVACSSNSSKTVNGVKAPSAAQVDSVSYLLGVNFGSTIKQYGFGDLNYDKILQGLKDMVNSKGNPVKDTNFFKQFKINPKNMNVVITSYLQQRKQLIQAENILKEKEFFADLKAKKVDSTAKGLYYSIKSQGAAKKISAQDTVYIHYKGTLPNGTVFDEVVKEKPSAKLVLSQVVPGFAEGLQLVGNGGDITLYIPSALAYGSMGQPRAGIEPNTPLTFEVQVDSVRSYVAPAPVKATKATKAVKKTKKSHKK